MDTFSISLVKQMRGSHLMNFSLEQNVDILSAYHVERFTYLRDNEQYQDADAIASRIHL